MDLSPKLSAVIILVLLLGSTEMQGSVHVAMAARECKSQSHRFKGPCLRAANCATVCLTEGFTSGKCEGFRSLCFCTKSC
ncbi:hypothetical protein HU200_015706 [Digitaria exilis]|uniref:Knottins-like domain-containing protein n=1 Tax=Digitaria exilis TaxID=1010633 RepID=A0A835F8Q0_9POAL|nr:hypothetical protein HU200_015706 [Digitaria exilis]CAB3456187.1 unnamed protein product [Digitaria exilis]